MIIIVEGPDGAGKTTRINQLLAAHPGSTYQHFSNPKTPQEADDYWQVYAQAIKATDPNKVAIFDRSWYSDRVYGPIFRNRMEMLDLHVEMLEALVVKYGGGYVIYCTAPVNVLWKRCKERGETYVKTIEQLSDIHDGYEAVMKQDCGLPVMRIDTSAKWYA